MYSAAEPNVITCRSKVDSKSVSAWRIPGSSSTTKTMRSFGVTHERMRHSHAEVHRTFDVRLPFSESTRQHVAGVVNAECAVYDSSAGRQHRRCQKIHSSSGPGEGSCRCVG